MKREAPFRMPSGCLAVFAGSIVIVTMLSVWGPLRTAVLLVVTGGGGLIVRRLWRGWFPHRATRELNIVIGRTRVQGRARLIRRKCRHDGHQWTIAWKVPTGVTATALTNVREVLEHALDCSAEFWFERGVIWMRAGTARLPQQITYAEFYGHE